MQLPDYTMGRDYALLNQLRAAVRETEVAATEAFRVGNKYTRKDIIEELNRLSKQPFGSSEATVIRNYLDVCLELPWGKKTRERVSVEAARKVLDKDHYGLEKVKERILEFLAVKQLAPELKGQVICLVGPPGVGRPPLPCPWPGHES